MSDKTGIEWTDATWNPVTGCTKVSQGCKHCYAKHQAWPRLSAMPNTVYTGREFEQVMCHPERLDQPLRWTKPRRIFVNSMSDLFHEDVPFEFIASVFAVMAVTTRHTYQVLTKRPARMLEFFKWVLGDNDVGDFEADGRIGDNWPKNVPWDGYDNCGPLFPYENVWLGVSVEDQAAADERIPLLLQTPAAVRWISAEPLLGPIDLPGLFYYGTERTGGVVPLRDRGHAQLDWVVVGGESGPNARPMHPAWARSLRDQCAAAGVPFLFKQWGEWCPRGPESKGYPLDERDKIAKVKINTAGENDAFLTSVNGREPTWMQMSGKKRAGRLLDGAQHDGYPVAQGGAA